MMSQAKLSSERGHRREHGPIEAHHSGGRHRRQNCNGKRYSIGSDNSQNPTSSESSRHKCPKYPQAGLSSQYYLISSGDKTEESSYAGSDSSLYLSTPSSDFLSSCSKAEESRRMHSRHSHRSGKRSKNRSRPVKCSKNRFRLPHRFAKWTVSTYEEVRRHEVLWLEPDVPAGKVLVTVLNYNVLAQDLIDVHPHIYKDHDPENLEWSQRQQLLMKEFLMSEADIIALQEVQEDHIPSFYKTLEDHGYRGFFKKRTSRETTDGCALYYKTKSFELIEMEEVQYKQPGINILDRPNVALIARLKHKVNEKELIIANTHLLYNPKRWDIRLAQIQILLAELHRIASPSESPSILLVGDLNSQPDSPIVRLLEKGFYEAERAVLPDDLGILPNCTHLSTSKLYHSKTILSVFDSDDESCDVSGPNSCSKPDSRLPTEQEQSNDIVASQRENYLKTYPRNQISHGFNFLSTYNFFTPSNRREATTYQDRWITVDYMFYSNLTLISRQRLPTVEECVAYVGRIPSTVVGSDHLPLLATYAL